MIHVLALITGVVVFPDRAQVTRSEKVTCGQRQVVSFGAIPPSADPQSFRAHIEGGSVDGLRVEKQLRSESFGKEAQEIDDQVEKLDAELRALDDARERDRAAAKLADEYAQVAQQMIAREMSQPAPNLKAWSAAYEQALQARLKAAAETEANADARRTLSRKRDELQRKRAKLAAAAGRHTWLAEAIVSCKSGTAPVRLSYMVGGASWAPSYSARTEGSGSVELATSATVTQSTGEDWTHAQVILSTALPRDHATPPEIQPLKVWADEARPPRKVIVSREEYRPHAETSVAVAANTTAVLDGRLRSAEQGLSVQLAVPEPADVLGDGTPARLEVGRVMLKGTLKLRSVPKMAPFVFRVAELTNAAPFPLLPGPIDLFRKGDFMARYQLERVAQGERMNLTFGLEEAVKVKRTVVEELKRDQGVLGPSRRRTFVYRFDVANHQARADEVEISEHVPVSELDDVKVSIDAKLTTAGYDHRNADGVVTWRLKLQPGEKRTVELRYFIEVPASYDASGT
jgi:uncharacterized protein (TIGR02231 family)